MSFERRYRIPSIADQISNYQQDIVAKKPGSEELARQFEKLLHESYAELLEGADLVKPSWKNVVFGNGFDAIQHRRILFGDETEGVVVRATDPPKDFDVFVQFVSSGSLLMVRKNPYYVDIESLKTAADVYDILIAEKRIRLEGVRLRD